MCLEYRVASRTRDDQLGFTHLQPAGLKVGHCFREFFGAACPVRRSSAATKHEADPALESFREVGIRPLHIFRRRGAELAAWKEEIPAGAHAWLMAMQREFVAIAE